MTGAGIANDRNKECSAAAMTQKAPTCAAHDHNRNAVETSAACTRYGCRVQGGRHLREVAEFGFVHTTDVKNVAAATTRAHVKNNNTTGLRLLVMM